MHAFHCSDDKCAQKTCPETKNVLRRMKLHVEQCRNQTPDCKVCKLWQALHRTKSSGSNNPNMQGGGGGGGGHANHMAHMQQQQQRQQQQQQQGGHPMQRVGSMGGGGHAMMGGQPRPMGQGPSPGGRPGVVNSAQQEQLRQKLRQLDPAQVR